MNAKALIFAFLGGAIVGCGSALLFAPEKGEDIRKRLCRIIKKKGLKISDDEVDALVAELTGE
ncbi:MAG: YtxH domain-containing protein [Muribaculaceae bacterium]|nr:YtxH domain-containing protein [Muribaculaceae bacterium]